VLALCQFACCNSATANCVLTETRCWTCALLTTVPRKKAQACMQGEMLVNVQQVSAFTSSSISSSSCSPKICFARARGHARCKHPWLLFQSHATDCNNGNLRGESVLISTMRCVWMDNKRCVWMDYCRPCYLAGPMMTTTYLAGFSDKIHSEMLGFSCVVAICRKQC